jgi:hypothetical protein
MGGYRDHSEASEVEVVEEVLVEASVVVAVVDNRHSLAGFESGIAAESAPVVDGHRIEQEDMSVCYRLAIRSRPLRALAGCRC